MKKSNINWFFSFLNQDLKRLLFCKISPKWCVCSPVCSTRNKIRRTFPLIGEDISAWKLSGTWCKSLWLLIRKVIFSLVPIQARAPSLWSPSQHYWTWGFSDTNCAHCRREFPKCVEPGAFGHQRILWAAILWDLWVEFLAVHVNVNEWREAQSHQITSPAIRVFCSKAVDSSISFWGQFCHLKFCRLFKNRGLFIRKGTISATLIDK